LYPAGRLFMTRQVPIAYTRPFARIFDAPVGALIDHAGMSKWPYHCQRLIGSRRSSDSYACDAGGIKGTSSTVVAVVRRITG
jgi:hypothetical protein